MFRIKIHGISEEQQKDEVASRIRKAYDLAFDRFSHAIRNVDIGLTDVNGPRGGVDKVCRVQLRIEPRGAIVVRSSGANCLQAAKGAFEKVKGTLSRALQKRRRLRPIGSGSIA
jgi:hypothetical protein